MSLARSSAGYSLDNIEFTSVGFDVGSATSQATFAHLRFARDALGLSSRYAMAATEALWRSPILLTPYLDDGQIDAERIQTFAHDCYESAGLSARDVDTGAVILTGEALKRRNARRIAEALAVSSGSFVCVTAGHRLEAMLAAYGSGSVEISRAQGKSILCIDIGGATTKFALIRSGDVELTAAVAIGGRIVSWNGERRITFVNDSARHLLRNGSRLAVGRMFGREEEAELRERAAEHILAVARGQTPRLLQELSLTGPLPRALGEVDVITFSGGVAEYIYGREEAEYGDVGKGIGTRLREAVQAGAVGPSVLDPGQGIRSTVVGASQRSVQVSGNTGVVSDPEALPLRNVPVLRPAVNLDGRIDPKGVSDSIRKDVDAFGGGLSDLESNGMPAALAFRWGGLPTHERLQALAVGIRDAVASWGGGPSPVVVMLDRDVAASLGRILGEELALPRPLVCLDNLELMPLDYVDVGVPVAPAGVYPVVIKSLLFAQP